MSVLSLYTISMNLLFKSSGQHCIPFGGGGGDEGKKLTPCGEEAGRPISMVSLT